ncbi:hypothetical protein ACFLR2_02595 [Chlamydiota bacterium]
MFSLVNGSPVKGSAESGFTPHADAQRDAGDDKVGDVARGEFGKRPPAEPLRDDRALKVVKTEDSSAFRVIPDELLARVFYFCGFRELVACRAVYRRFNICTQRPLVLGLIAEMEQVVSSVPDNSTKWSYLVRLAKAYVMGDQKEKAIEVFNLAIESISHHSDDDECEIVNILKIAEWQAASNLFEAARQTVVTAFQKSQEKVDNKDDDLKYTVYREIALFYTKFKGKSDLSDVEKILCTLEDELKNPPLCFFTNLPALLKIDEFPEEASGMVYTCTNMLLRFADYQFCGKLFEECEKTLHQLNEFRKLAFDEMRKWREPDNAFADIEYTIRGRMMQVLFTRGKDQQVFDSLDPACLNEALCYDYSTFWDLSKYQESSQKAKELFNFGKKKILNGGFCESDQIEGWIMDIMKAQVAWGMVEEAKETAVELKAFFDQLKLHERVLSFERQYHVNPCSCSSEEFVEKIIAYCQTEYTRCFGEPVKERASSNVIGNAPPDLDWLDELDELLGELDTVGVDELDTAGEIMVMGNMPPGKLLKAKEKADSLPDGLEKLDALLEVLASLDPVKSM